MANWQRFYLFIAGCISGVNDMDKSCITSISNTSEVGDLYWFIICQRQRQRWGMMSPVSTTPVRNVLPLSLMRVKCIHLPVILYRTYFVGNLLYTKFILYWNIFYTELLYTELFYNQCSETMLTGESQFHISTPLGIESGSLMTGSKQVDHWTSGLCMNEVRLQVLHRAFPQQPIMLVVKLEGVPAVRVKLWQKICVRSSGIITFSARRPSDGSRLSLPQTMPQGSITSGSPM
jgi:hypothetical protein